MAQRDYSAGHGNSESALSLRHCLGDNPPTMKPATPSWPNAIAVWFGAAAVAVMGLAWLKLRPASSKGAAIWAPHPRAQPVRGDAEDPMGSPGARFAVPAESIEERVAGRSSSPEQSGRDRAAAPSLVTWTFIDGNSGEPLRKARLRGATEERYLDQTPKSGAEIALSPGTWTFRAWLPGYEVTELAPFTVHASDSLELPPVRLRRGSASISSRIDVPESVAETGPFTVVLQGPTKRQRSVEASEPFQLDGLLSGEYRLSVSNAKKRLCFQRALTVDRGELAHLDLRMDFADREFFVIGPDGAPFEGRWKEDDVTCEAPLEFYFGLGPHVVAVAETKAKSASFVGVSSEGKPVRGSRHDRVFLRDPHALSRRAAIQQSAELSAGRTARDSMKLIRQSSAIEEALLAAALARGKRSEDTTTPENRPPDDRRRKADDKLTFDPRSADELEAPKPDNAKTLRARRVGEGLYRIERMPGTAETLLLTCGPYHATVPLRGFGSASNGAVEVSLIERCPTPTKRFELNRTCFDCHEQRGLMTGGR